jgi:spermidine synthase
VPAMVASAALPVALVAFFLSGFAALLYQVVWQRLLVLFSGSDVDSVTVIVAAFMAGLGIGYLCGGYLADRVSPLANLLLFSICELAIGAFGIASKAIYYDLLYERLAALAAFPTGAAVLFLSLLWPTFFMGLSLPLLARALTRTVATAGAVVGALYGCNTIGAAAGAFFTTWWLIPRMGLETSLFVGAALNAACALAAWLVIWQLRRSAPTDARGVVEVAGPRAVDALLPFQAWVVVYGLTGFTALALEILWFRILGVALKSTTFTFGTLMAVYLAALGLGASVAAARVVRTRRPGLIFLWSQVAVIVIAGLSISALLALIEAGWLPLLSEHIGGEDPYDVYGGVGALREIVAGRHSSIEWERLGSLIALYGVLPIALIGGPTFLMGFSFPYLQRVVQADFARIGRRVGVLLTSNIVGSTLGAMIAGWLLLPVLGTPAALRLVLSFGVVLGGVLLYSMRRAARPRGFVAGAIVASMPFAAIAPIPESDRFWAVLHGSRPDHIIVNEDGAGLSLLKSEQPGPVGQTHVFVNGLSQSRIPYGNIHTVLGALPLLLHPSPRDVAVIGLGSGDTAFALGGLEEVRRIVCIEIIGAQRRSLERFAAVAPDPGLVMLLRDPRVEHVVDDGRAYLVQTDRRFDIIEADALRRSSAYSGNLYSVEYFELMRRRLAPNGLAVTWSPTERVRNGFLRVFPHAASLGPDILIGSNEPILLDRDALEARLASPTVREYYGRAGVNLDNLLAEYIDDVTVYGPEDERGDLRDVNSDVFPRDEFSLPRVLPF